MVEQTLDEGMSMHTTRRRRVAGGGRERRQPRSRRVGVGCAVAIVLLAASCGDDSSSSDSTTSTSAPAPTTSDPTTSEPTTTTIPTAPTVAALQPGDPCSPEEGLADCTDQSSDGTYRYIVGYAQCEAEGGLCVDLDGDGYAGYPDSG